MPVGYTILEHPADLGIEAFGTTLAEAFEQAARGMMSVIVELPSVECLDSQNVKLEAIDIEQLLVRWLEEVLYRYDGEKFVAVKFKVHSISQVRLSADIFGESLTAGKHRTKLDIKAVTYHQLIVREDGKGGYVRIFLDI